MSQVVLQDELIVQDRYELAIDASNAGLVDWDLERDAVFYSSRWKEMLGYVDTYKLKNSPYEWLSRLHPDDHKKVIFGLETFFQEKTKYYRAEFRLRHRNGAYLWILCKGLAIRSRTGKAVRFVCTQVNITKRKKNEQKLIYDALHDVLTELPNRALFMDRLNQALLSRNPFAVLYIDLDHFKEVNDSLGHEAGDTLLKMVARRLENVCRAGDTIARMGGDEFIVLLTNLIQKEELEMLAVRLLKEVSAPLVLQGKKINPQLSIGITLGSSLTYKHSEDIIRDADVALYQAKEKGKARYEIFQKDMDHQPPSIFSSNMDLRKAIKDDQILIHYQPIVSLQTNKIAGIEAFLRWHPHKDTLLMAGEIIPLAESMNLTSKLGLRVIKNACREFSQLQGFLKNNSLFLALNIFVQHLTEPHFAEILTTTLQNENIHPSQIYLEIVENMNVSNTDQVSKVLETLKNRGIHVSFDNFFAKHSCLGCSSPYPLDALKIDRLFIKKMEKELRFQKLVQYTIKFAHSLNLKVFTQGVETQDAFILLKELDCDYAQGFYFSKPLPIKRMENLLKANPEW